MSTITKYRYIQAIFIGLPMGIVSLYYGGKDLLDIKQNVNDYQSFYGIVDSVFVDYLRIRNNSEPPTEVLCVIIDNKLYYLTYEKHRAAVKKNLDVGDTVSIWYEQKEIGNKKIKAIKSDASEIIKYEPGGYWVGIFFLLWGLLWAIISLLYIFKHPQDLMGGNKKESGK